MFFYVLEALLNAKCRKGLFCLSETVIPVLHLNTRATNSNLLSETMLYVLDSTMQPLAEATDAVSDMDELQITDEPINNYENGSEFLKPE